MADTPRLETIAGPAGPIELRVAGERSAPGVLLVPSLGRGAADFNDLATRLADAGYLAVAPEPRGIAGSTGSLDGLTMFDLAADAAAAIEHAGDAPMTVVGHAFGNRVARMLATERPELVESLVLLACGGLVPPAPEHQQALRGVFVDDVSPEDHLAAVDTAFFAPGNDATVWRGGWYADVAMAQGLATRALDVEHWWMAGSAEVLVAQPADDVVALPENAERIAQRFGDRARLVVIDDAGHALLPEQPEAVAEAVLGWLAERRPSAQPRS